MLKYFYMLVIMNEKRKQYIFFIIFNENILLPAFYFIVIKLSLKRANFIKQLNFIHFGVLALSK